MRNAFHTLRLIRSLGMLALILGICPAAFAATSFVKVGELAPDFTLNDRATGKPVRLSDFSGKIIFLDLFAYW